jgi:GT2 family glycosyltransferase
VQGARPDRIDTAGIEFAPTLLAFDYLPAAPLAVLANGVRDPLGPCAGAAAFGRATFESVGGFDESFFAYLEDVDLVVRLLAAGGRCRLAPEAIGVHCHSATLGARSKRKNELIGWGRGYIIGKYRMHRRPLVFGCALLEEAVGALGKLLVDRTTAGIRPRLAGWRAGLRRDAKELPPLPAWVQEITFPDAQRRWIRRRLPAER